MSDDKKLDELVDRFLSWPLPDSVASDLCVTQRDYGKAQGWPKRVGTNLLTADETRQMLEYVLAPPAAPDLLDSFLEHAQEHGLESEEQLQAGVRAASVERSAEPSREVSSQEVGKVIEAMEFFARVNGQRTPSILELREWAVLLRTLDQRPPRSPEPQRMGPRPDGEPWTDCPWQECIKAGDCRHADECHGAGRWRAPAHGGRIMTLREIADAEYKPSSNERRCTCYVLPHADDCEIFVGITQSGERVEERRSGQDRRKASATPLPMLLFCPRCQKQHIDAPEPATGWTNPPHATHTCQHCGLLWRPSNHNTEGVEFVKAAEDKHIERIAASFPVSSSEPLDKPVAWLKTSGNLRRVDLYPQLDAWMGAVEPWKVTPPLYETPSATLALTKEELTELIDYHDWNDSGAEAMEMVEASKYHEERSKMFKAMRDALDSRNGQEPKA